MLNLRIRPQAALDIDEIIVYLREANPHAATEFVRALRQAFALLSDNPLIGAKRPYRLPALEGIRLFPLKKYSSYLVFYLNTDESLEIVRVLHGKRDLDSLFDEGSISE